MMVRIISKLDGTTICDVNSMTSMHTKTQFDIYTSAWFWSETPIGITAKLHACPIIHFECFEMDSAIQADRIGPPLQEGHEP